MPPKLRTQGLLYQEQEPLSLEEIAAGLLSRVPVVGPMLGEMVTPPMAGSGSDQPMLRTMPLQPQEVFDMYLEGGPKESFKDYTARTQEGKQSEFFDLSKAGPALSDAPQVPRYQPTSRADISRAEGLLGNKRVTRQAKKFAEKGMEKMPDRWYGTSPLYSMYVDELGPEAGRDKFIRDINIVASTSPRAKVPQNIKMASFYQYMAEQGLPLPESTRSAKAGYAPEDRFPNVGYGSIAQGNHLMNVKKIISGEGLNPQKNPKPMSFAANLLGNEDVITADTHYMRMLGMLSQDPKFLETKVEVTKTDDEGNTVLNKKGDPVMKEINPRAMHEAGELTMKEALKKPTYWVSAPTNTEYKKLEEVGKKLAKQLGVSPARFQEAAWVGAGELTGLQSPPEPYLRTLENRIKYTADVFGMDPEVVLKQYIRGEIPLAQMQDMNDQYGGLLG